MEMVILSSRRSPRIGCSGFIIRFVDWKSRGLASGTILLLSLFTCFPSNFLVLFPVWHLFSTCFEVCLFFRYVPMHFSFLLLSCLITISCKSPLALSQYPLIHHHQSIKQSHHVTAGYLNKRNSPISPPQMQVCGVDPLSSLCLLSFPHPQAFSLNLFLSCIPLPAH